MMKKLIHFQPKKIRYILNKNLNKVNQFLINKIVVDREDYLVMIKKNGETKKSKKKNIQ